MTRSGEREDGAAQMKSARTIVETEATVPMRFASQRWNGDTGVILTPGKKTATQTTILSSPSPTSAGAGSASPSLFLLRCVRISIRGLVCQSVRWSVGPLVGPSVMLSSKLLKNGLSWILNDSDQEKRMTRRKEV